jgi:hypothetical protein
MQFRRDIFPASAGTGAKRVTAETNNVAASRPRAIPESTVAAIAAMLAKKAAAPTQITLSAEEATIMIERCRQSELLAARQRKADEAKRAEEDKPKNDLRDKLRQAAGKGDVLAYKDLYSQYEKLVEVIVESRYENTEFLALREAFDHKQVDFLCKVGVPKTRYALTEIIEFVISGNLMIVVREWFSKADSSVKSDLLTLILQNCLKYENEGIWNEFWPQLNKVVAPEKIKFMLEYLCEKALKHGRSSIALDLAKKLPREKEPEIRNACIQYGCVDVLKHFMNPELATTALLVDVVKASSDGFTTSAQKHVPIVKYLVEMGVVPNKSIVEMCVDLNRLAILVAIMKPEFATADLLARFVNAYKKDRDFHSFHPVHSEKYLPMLRYLIETMGITPDNSIVNSIFESGIFHGYLRIKLDDSQLERATQLCWTERIFQSPCFRDLFNRPSASMSSSSPAISNAVASSSTAPHRRM